MKLLDLFEQRTGPVERTTNHKHLYHLTGNAGIGLAVETNKLMALRQSYISTTYRASTADILGRQHYHYKLILNGPKLAVTYGVFPYDHQVTQVGPSSRKVTSADEAEIGIDTKEIEPLSDFLEGVVILSQPYTENQVLFLADVNRIEGSYQINKRETIHAITALNRLSVPLYWQRDGRFVRLNARDHAYLRDIEAMMHAIEHGKSRNQRHLDILDKLLDRYDIKTGWEPDKISLDRQITMRRRMIPQMMNELNSYFRNRPVRSVDPKVLKAMLERFLTRMKFGNNVKTMVMSVAEDYNFFHPVVAPVAWTVMIGDLVNGDVEAALRDIKYEKPSARKIEDFESDRWSYIHAGTGMEYDDP